MKVIRYIQLFEYLMKEEGLNAVSAYRSIQRVRRLPVEFKQAVWQVLHGCIPEMEYNDITLKELIEQDEMKPIRAIMMLDWIRREPVVAMRYMMTERMRAPLNISESDMERVNAALERFKMKSSIIPDADTPIDESDIEIGDEDYNCKEQ